MRMKCVGNETGMRMTEMCAEFLVNESEGEKPLGETRCRWEDNIKVVHKVIEFYGMDWVHLTQVVSCLQHGRKRSYFIQKRDFLG
jgi:hypothetical protein